MPWSDEEIQGNILTYSYLKSRSTKSDVSMRTVPKWYDFCIMTVDVQKRWLYWHLDAYKRDGTSQVVEYGVVDIVDDTDRAISKALSDVADIAMEGWPLSTDYDHIVIPRLRMIDTGYRYDVISPWLQTHPDWHGIKGVGKSVKNSKRTGKQPIFEIPGIMQVRPQPDGNRLWFIEVDNTKAIVHDRYFIETGEPGYTEVPMDVTQGYMMSLAAEKREYSKEDDTFKWVKVRRRNDYLDCRSYSVAGAMYVAQKMKREDSKLAKKVEDNRKTEIAATKVDREKEHSLRNKHIIDKPRRKAPGQSFLNSSGRFFN